MKVVGLTELVLDLGKEATLAPERAQKVTHNVAAKVKATMQQLAPRDEGTLIESITYRTHATGWGAVGEIGPTATRDGFPYPMAVEYGTSKMAPQPFAGPALDQHTDAYVKGITDEVSQL